MKSFSDISRSLVFGSADEGKALRPLVEASDPAIFMQTGGQRVVQREAKRHLEAYGGLDAVDYAAEAADLYALTAGEAEFHFERNGKKLYTERTDTTPAYAETAPPDLVRLLKHPNPWQTWDEFMQLMVIDYLFVGNSYWLKYAPNEDGKPAALYRLHPAQVTVVAGDKRMVDHYEYSTGRGEPIKYSPDEVIHFKRPNPHSEHIGLGTIASGPRVLDIELSMTDSLATYYEQGMRVSGVLETDRTVPDNIFQKIKRQMQSVYSGTKNSYKVPVLQRGLKFKAISGSAVEAEFAKLGPQSMKRIYAMFKVPAILMGVFDNADRQAVREAKRNWDNNIMKPFLGRLASRISLALTQHWGVDIVFDYEYDMPIEDRFDLADSMAVLPGVRVREIREMVKLPPLGPDEKGPDGKPIDEMVLNLPGSNDNASKVKDQPIGSEPGRPPNPKNTRPFPGQGDQMPADAQVQSAKAIRQQIRDLRKELIHG